MKNYPTPFSNDTGDMAPTKSLPSPPPSPQSEEEGPGKGAKGECFYWSAKVLALKELWETKAEMDAKLDDSGEEHAYAAKGELFLCVSSFCLWNGKNLSEKFFNPSLF